MPLQTMPIANVAKTTVVVTTPLIGTKNRVGSKIKEALGLRREEYLAALHAPAA